MGPTLQSPHRARHAIFRWGTMALLCTPGTNARPFHAKLFSTLKDWVGRDYLQKRKALSFQNIQNRYFLKLSLQVRAFYSLGCLIPDLLPELKVKRGVGIEISQSLTQIAQEQSPQHRFIHGLPEEIDLDETFDYIVLPIIVDYTEDLLYLLQTIRKYAHRETVFIISAVNPIWHRLANIASRAKLRIPDKPRNVLADKILRFSLSSKGL